MAETKTTQEIAAYLGVTVQSVNRYIRKACDAEGISVSNFGTTSPKDKRIRTFSEAEVGLILKYAPEQPIATPQVTVEAGSDLILAAPELPQAYDLQGLRQSEALVIEDPIEFAQKFLALADQVKTAMQQDIAARELRLQATRQAKNAIEAQAAELKLETRLYQLQATNLDKTLTQETVALQEAAQTLKPLGKGQAG